MAVRLDKYGEKALELVMKGKSFFLTGKAGTGKTTVLREIVEQCKHKKKNVVVLAPTGVAAKAANGKTIHSFLNLPTGPYIPGMRKRGLYNLNDGKRRLVEKLDILFIDEVSMVRCDLMDEVDEVLKHYRNSRRPFGGIQIVLIGDLYQLIPVAPEEEWLKIKDVYASPYFFHSKVIERMDFPLFELMKVQRQDSRDFVNLLNSIREGHLSLAEMQSINLRYKKGFTSKGNDRFIRLTTHNRKADRENYKRLKRLPGKEFEYKAYIEDDYPSCDYPTDYVIRLKRGARVMFVRNDNEFDNYVNSTLGTVTALDEDSITVKTDEGIYVEVEKQHWTYYEYHINKKTKEIETIPCGTFTQYPLKLAWAVTIHKSQGLTFDKVIVDVGNAFTFGQVYVALSRCTSLEGVVLVSPVTAKNVSTDPLVVDFMRSTPRIDTDVVEKPIRLPAPARKCRQTWAMLQEGLSPEQIAARRKLTIGTIYGHIALLIEYGCVDIARFVNPDTFNSIIEAIRKVGINSPLSKIKAECIDSVAYTDIKMVIADIKRQGTEEKYNSSDDDLLNNSEWYFVDDVPFSLTSKRFLSYDCRVVLSPLGYYLEVMGDYIKLGDYPKGYTCNNPDIWIKKPKDKRGYRMAHHANGATNLIGYLREEKDLIAFTTPNGEEYIITFNDD